jgi:hypothetical protein
MLRYLAASLVLGLSCGGTTTAPRGHVCDGSGSIRLAMAVTDDPGRVLLGMQVMFDNGDGFLYVAAPAATGRHASAIPGRASATDRSRSTKPHG